MPPAHGEHWLAPAAENVPALQSIGAAYEYILSLLEALCEQYGEPAVFSGDAALQVPVMGARKIANLSDAVVWAREHQPEARAIARAAARLVEGALSERALAFYTGRLLHRFALLDAAHRPKQPKFHANAWVGIFRCRTAPSAVLECGFVAPGANETTRFSESMMAIKP